MKMLMIIKLHHNPFKRFTPSQFILFLVPAILTIQACYSTTAVEGVPVNELQFNQDIETSRRAQSEAQREEIAIMSRATQNRVFEETNGIPEYRIGPLDVLEIASRVGEKVTRTSIIVNNRGQISYSFVDDLNVAGLTSSQLDEELTQRLSNYIKRPRIDVRVTEFKSKKAYVLGEFSSIRRTDIAAKVESGKIPLKGKITLVDLISLASGYTVNADLKNVRLIRQGKSYSINVYEIIENGADWMNVIIDDGDVVDIPELPAYREKVYVMGAVKKQGIYSLKNIENLLSALSLAGMFTPEAKEQNTLVIRGRDQSEQPLIMMADIDSLLKKGDLSQNIALEDGDLVYVPRQRIGDINEWIGLNLKLLDFVFYPRRFQSEYFYKDHLKLDSPDD
jgi:polysaccharide export outer membrane protein